MRSILGLAATHESHCTLYLNDTKRHKLFYGGKLFAEAETVDVKVHATLDP